MADSAKLELLARSGDAAPFQIFEIDSGRAYWAYKPCRLPPTEWEVTPQPRGADGAHHFVLKNLRQDSYLLLNSAEHFLWEHFDGRHSLEEIARAFHLKFGAFEYAVIRRLLAKLYSCGLLERQSISELQASDRGASSSLRWTKRFGRKVKKWRAVSFRVPQADRVCTLIYERGGFLLFHPVTLGLIIVAALFALALAARLSYRASEFAVFFRSRPFLITGMILVTLFGASILHVLVHALACKAHGRRVRELGFFLLQGLVPTFYADVTDIFMSTRRARVAVDLAGPMVEVVLGSAAIISAHAASGGMEQALLFGIGVALWESALINLYPFNFLEMDGYNIIADLLAMPMLRQQALALIPNLFSRLRSLEKMKRAEWLQLSYLALCLVSVVIYLIAHIDGLRALIHLP